jgi:branched-chain amino acid transport system substrate-binding protein
MRRRIAVAFAVALLVVGIAPFAAAEEPYEFYTIISTTGAAAFIGRDEVPAFNAIEKYVNQHGGIRGRPLHINILDDGSSPNNAVQLANQVMAKRVPAFVGPGFGATCNAVLPLVEKSGPVMYCFSSVMHAANGSYAFVYNLENRDFIANGLRFLRSKGVRRIGLLETTDATGNDATLAAQQALQYPDLRDLTIIATERYGPTDLSVTAQVSRLKAAGVDAIANYVTGPAFGTALHAISDVGYAGWIFSSSSNASHEQMRSYLPFLPEKLVFGTLGFQMTGILPSPVRVAKATFLDAIHQVGIAEPTIGNMIPWDPMMIVVSGLRKYGTDITATQMRDYILSLHDFAGNMGMYDFRRGDQRGLDPKSTGTMRYDKATDTFVVISRPGGEPF